MKNIIKLTGILTLSTLLVACTSNGQASNLNSNNPENVKVVEVQKSANDESNTENQDENQNENDQNENLKDKNEENQSQEVISAPVELTFPSTEYIVNGNEENKTVSKT